MVGGRSVRCRLFSDVVSADPNDWRRMGQERDLPPGTVFLRRSYRALSEAWEHDQCEMCSVKFMDPHFSPGHAEFIREHPEVLTTGLVTQVLERRRERWVCTSCYKDFAGEYGWTVIAE